MIVWVCWGYISRGASHNHRVGTEMQEQMCECLCVAHLVLVWLHGSLTNNPNSTQYTVYMIIHDYMHNAQYDKYA
jgi:hypothetical protein